MTHKKLSKSPIREALFDIKYDTLPNLLSDEKFKVLTNKTIQTHPKTQEQIQIKGNLNFSNSELKQTNDSPLKTGVLFEDKDRDSVIQYRINGYTYNRIGHYDGWDLFKSNAIKYWITLNDHISDIFPKTVSLRYINSFPISNTLDLSNILKSPPIPPIDGAQLFGIFSRVTFQKNDLIGNYTLTIEKNIENHLYLIVDINLHSKDSTDLQKNKLSNILDQMRIIKNDIFFNVIAPCKIEELL